MKIPYYVRSVYGVNRMYIADAEQASTIAGLVKMRTLDPDDKERFEKLGIEFEKVHDPGTEA